MKLCLCMQAHPLRRISHTSQCLHIASTHCRLSPQLQPALPAIRLNILPQVLLLYQCCPSVEYYTRHNHYLNFQLIIQKASLTLTPSLSLPFSLVFLCLLSPSSFIFIFVGCLHISWQQPWCLCQNNN